MSNDTCIYSNSPWLRILSHQILTRSRKVSFSIANVFRFVPAKFFKKYPMSFLQYRSTQPSPHHNRTQRPLVLQLSPPHLLVWTQTWQVMKVTDFNFPHMSPRKVIVFNYYTLVSDDLITSDPHSGQYTTTFKCNITMRCSVGRIMQTKQTFQPYRGLGRRCVN
jgi:hypothetical protein